MSIAAVLAITFVLGLQDPATPPHPPGRIEANGQPALTILFFTAPWCEPCREVSPILERFASKDEKRVKLVAIDFDRARSEAKRWGVREIPVVIVLSPQGQVLLRYEGAQQQALATLASELENLLKTARERK
jgi:thioredoxin-like negative regulator of GroEL